MPPDNRSGSIRKVRPQCEKTLTNLGNAVVLFLFFFSCLSLGSASPNNDDSSILTSIFKLSAAKHPTEFVELDSDKWVIALLTGGRSTEFTVSWSIALKGRGVDKSLRIAEYKTKLICDDTSILHGDSDCKVNTSVSKKSRNHNFSYYNSIAVCTAERFPGVTNCRLSLDPVPGSSGKPLESKSKSILVSGLAIYDIEGLTNGSVSKDTEIYSGVDRGLVRSSYAKDNSNSGLFGVRIILPDGTQVVGESAELLINAADISTNETDAIFLYDQASCLPGNFSSHQASDISGVLQLAPAESCGFGIAPGQNGSDSLFGVRLRPFKAGRKDITFTWSNFQLGNNGNRIDVPYSQILSMRVEDQREPPPVITEISLISDYGEFSATPCDMEGRSLGVLIRAYNVRKSESRIFQILEASTGREILQEWGEDNGSFVYDSLTDSSTFRFRNGGGNGRTLKYQLAVQFVGEPAPRIAVPLSSGLELTGLNFSEPIAIHDIIPSVLDFSGGEVTLVGHFHGISFDYGDRIVIEGDVIPPNLTIDILSQNRTHLVFRAPDINQLEGTFVAIVFVEICGSSTNFVQLKYGVPPKASLWSADLSARPFTSIQDADFDLFASSGNGTYFLLPNSAPSIVFVVDNVASSQAVGNYQWRLSEEDGTLVDLEAVTKDLPTFTINTNVIPKSNMDYLLTATIEDEGGSDAVTAILRKAPSETVTLAVSLYPVPHTRISQRLQPVLVHSSVQLFGKSLDSSIAFEWEYRGQSYLISGEIENRTCPFSINRTAPTKFGQQFNIAPQDLIVGSSEIKLSAYLEGDANIRGSARVAVEVGDCDVIALINSGANGEAIDVSNSFTLSAAAYMVSRNISERDDLSFDWFDCRQSRRRNFDLMSGLDCSEIFVGLGRGLETVQLAAAELRTALGTELKEMYLSFGLRVRSRTNKTDVVRQWFRLIDFEGNDASVFPSMKVIRFETLEGNQIDRKNVNSLREIAVRPESLNVDVSWTFDLKSRETTIELNEEVVLEGLNNNDGRKSSDLIIRAGGLEDNTTYVLILKLLDERTEKRSELEIDFRTSALPWLSCTSSGEPEGLVDETQFVISAQASPSLPDLIYCFHIVNLETNSRNLVGLGCSNVRVAKFSWPVVGRFAVECELQTMAGETIRVEQIRNDTQIQVLTRRGSLAMSSNDVDPPSTSIDEQLVRLKTCVFSRNYICMLQMATTFPQLMLASLSLPNGENFALLNPQAGEELTATLCNLLQAMSLQTVFTPGDVLSTVDSTASMTSLPPDFFDVDSLLSCVYPISLAINATSQSASAPISDKRLLNSLNVIANYSITTAAHLAASTERTRLSSIVDDGGGENALFSLFLENLPMFSAQLALQNEGCGFEHAFDTSVVGGATIEPAVHMYLSVLCEGEKDATFNIRSLFENQLDVEVSICRELLSENLAASGSERFSVVAKQTDPIQFCSTEALSGAHSIFTSPFAIAFPRQIVGRGIMLPSDCIRVKVPRLTGVPCVQQRKVQGEEGKEAQASPENTTSNLNLSKQVVTRSYLSSKVQGGLLEGYKTFQSPKLDQTSNLTVVAEDVRLLLHENHVTFEFRGQGQILGVYTRSPGDVPVGASVNLALFVGIAVGAVALVAIGLASTQARFVAGAPLAANPDTQYVERDQFARVWNPDSTDLQDAPGYASSQHESDAESQLTGSKAEEFRVDTATRIQDTLATLMAIEEYDVHELPLDIYDAREQRNALAPSLEELERRSLS